MTGCLQRICCFLKKPEETEGTFRFYFPKNSSFCSPWMLWSKSGFVGIVDDSKLKVYCSDVRPDIFVMTQIDKESIPDSDSGVHSNANKMGKLGLNGSVSEEDSGVGSEGNNQSDIADQTDTSSHVDTDSLKPVSRNWMIHFFRVVKGPSCSIWYQPLTSRFKFWHEPKIATHRGQTALVPHFKHLFLH